MKKDCEKDKDHRHKGVKYLEGDEFMAVSYTHLTLPTNREA